MAVYIRNIYKDIYVAQNICTLNYIHNSPSKNVEGDSRGARRTRVPVSPTTIYFLKNGRFFLPLYKISTTIRYTADSLLTLKVVTYFHFLFL